MYGPGGNVTIESLRRSAEQFQEVPDDVDDGIVLGSTFSRPGGEENSVVIVRSTIRFPVVNTRYWILEMSCTPTARTSAFGMDFPS